MTIWPDAIVAPGRAGADVPRVVVDTNILVGGLLMRDGGDPLARIVAGMCEGTLPVAVCPALLAEYREVLSRPKIAARHHRGGTEVEAVLAAIAHHATVLSPPLGRPAPDPGDQMLWDLLCANANLRLVTADKVLLRDRGMVGQVVTAVAYAAERFP